MGRRDEKRTKADRADVQVGTRVAVWGDRGSDGTWYTKDIGIMKERPRMKNDN